MPAQSSIRNLPVNLFASAVGMAGLALAWRAAAPMLRTGAFAGEAIDVTAVLVFGAMALGYLAKLLRHRDAVAAEFDHPVMGNFFGMIAVALMLVSAVVAPWSTALQEGAWIVGAAATLLLSAIAIARLLRGGAAVGHGAVPAYLIPGVAALDIAVAGSSMPMSWAPELNLFGIAIGAVFASVLFMLVFHRLVHGEPLPAAMLPSLMILVAPFEVGFLAYTNITHTVDNFAALLFYFGLFMFAVLAWPVFRSGAPFAPAWWAIGFPIAALAIAATRYAEATHALPLVWLAGVLLAILTAAILVLTARTLHALFSGKLLST